MTQLSKLREKLEEINALIFRSLYIRSVVVYDIQKVKNSYNQAIYDQRRELDLFKKDSKRLSNLNEKELLIYSLIIENDANKFNGSYPSWSDKEHLISDSNNTLAELTNPLLLALFDKKSYSSLNIKHEYEVDNNELK